MLLLFGAANLARGFIDVRAMSATLRSKSNALRDFPIDGLQLRPVSIRSRELSPRKKSV